MDIRTTLTLNGRSYDINLFDQCFYRLVGWRGNLLSHYPADGDLYVSMEVPEDYFILEFAQRRRQTSRTRKSRNLRWVGRPTRAPHTVQRSLYHFI